MDSFDTDVLIYPAVLEHGLGRRIGTLFITEADKRSDTAISVGSVLLVPELRSKPLHDHEEEELGALGASLGRLDLLPTDKSTAELATALGSAYDFRSADASHLATAVGAGADRLITNNRADFPKSITEIDVTYPDDLSEPLEWPTSLVRKRRR